MLLNNTVLNGSQQSAWGMTIRQLKGQTVGQKKRAKNTFTPSDATLAAQSVAAQVWSIFKFIKGAVVAGFTSKLTKQSAANKWYQYMYNNAFNIVGSTAALVPENIQVGLGDIAPTPFTASISAATQTLTLGWSTAITSVTQLDTDLVGFALYNVDKGYYYAQTVGVGDKNGPQPSAIVFPTGTFTLGDQVRVIPFMYGAPSTANQGKSSNSVNIPVSVAA